MTSETAQQDTIESTTPASDSGAAGGAESSPPPNKVETAVVAPNVASSETPVVTSLPARELTQKHPLMYTWVLWYCKSEKGKQWEDCLKEVAQFDTVEDFWALYNHIQLPSGLPYLSDYYLFKKGIMPMWEDAQNRDGGRWLVTIDRQIRNEVLDIYWLELLMAIVGEQFDDGSEFICGTVVNVRNKGDKISLWTKDAANEDVNRRIGQILKQKLNLQGSIYYEMHKDTSQKTGSMVKAQLRV